jgi:hypothetical protein
VLSEKWKTLSFLKPMQSMSLSQSIKVFLKVKTEKKFAMKSFLIFLTISALFSLAFAAASLEKIDVQILDQTKGAVKIMIMPTKPKTVDIEIECFVEAKDITVIVFILNLFCSSLN